MNLTEEQYKQACRDYEYGYTKAAEYVFDREGEYTPHELYWMSEDEIADRFGIESKYIVFGIVDFLANLEAMTSPVNVHSVRLS